MQADTITILLQPPLQGRPLADENLVRHLGRSLAQSQQPGIGEPFQQYLHHLGRHTLGHQLVGPGAPARRGAVVPEVGEPHEHVAHERPALGGNRVEQVVGRLGHGGPDPPLSR